MIQAKRELTQARGDYVDVLAESDKAQFPLAWAIDAHGPIANEPASNPQWARMIGILSQGQ